MPFAYLRDPLFLICFAVYWINRVLESYGGSPLLAQYYLNDIICIPFFIPMMLWLQRQLGWRFHDGPPTSYEIVIPLIIWSALFEVVLPLTPLWRGRTFADPYDIVCYTGGALFAMLFWRWRSRDYEIAPA